MHDSAASDTLHGATHMFMPMSCLCHYAAMPSPPLFAASAADYFAAYADISLRRLFFFDYAADDA